MHSAVARTVPTDLLQRHQTLLEVGEVIHAFRDVNELFRHLADCLRPLLICDGMAVGLLNDDKITIRLALAENWGTFPPEIGRSVPLSAVPAEIAIAEQRPVRFSLHDQQQAARYPLHAEVLKMAGWQTSYTVPLSTSLTQLGGIGCLFKEDVHLGEQELDFFQKVADQVAVAIENSLNFERMKLAEREKEKERDRLQLLMDLTNRLVTNLELSELLRAVAAGVKKVVPCACVAVLLPDAERGNLQVKALDFPESHGLFYEGLTVAVEGSMAGRAFKTASTIVANQIDPQNYFPEMYKIAAGEELKSQCFIPFLSHGRSLGVLSIARREERLFTPEEVDFLAHVAGQVALAVENSLNFEAVREAERQEKRERDRLQLLLEINNAVVSHLDLRELLKSIASSLRSIIPNDAATLILYDPESRRIRIQALDLQALEKIPFEEGLQIPMEGTPEGEAIALRRPVLVPRIDLKRFFSPWAKVGLDNGIRSGCAVPLIAHGHPLGAMGVVSMHEDAFNEEHAKLLEQCASQVAIAVSNALAVRDLESLKNKLAQEKLYLEDEIHSEINFKEIVGESTVLKAALEKVATVALSDATVLILGETGTGKELIARAIHDASRRKGRTFVKLNCAAIPTGLLESELFGHEKGAFTGAIAQKIGRMELAHGGTLFLDEVGDIPLELQPKLLRALQEREFERLGSVRTQKADVRILAATNRDLQVMVADKEFRSDLYYRLNVFPIAIPALRERQGDIPRLVRYFVSKYAKKMDKHIDSIPSASMERLQSWHWPGNVRELENFIERSVILTHGPALHVPLSELAIPDNGEVAPVTLRETERDHILKILKETRGTLAGPNGAAARLGVKRTTLQYKMKKLGITKGSY